MCVATMTLARSDAERMAIAAALRELSAHGLRVYITDGGSGAAWLEEMRALPGFILCEPAKGLWPQVISSLRAARASGARFVLYTEPDKLAFFRDHLDDFLAEVREDDTLGIALVSRSSDAYSTFPPFQQYTESVINRCCAELIGRSFDYSYGPFLLDPLLIDRFADVPDEIAWGWRPYAFALAHRLGLRVESFEKASACPAEQRGDERVYRMLQLAQSVEGLVLASKVPITKAD